MTEPESTPYCPECPHCSSFESLELLVDDDSETPSFESTASRMSIIFALCPRGLIYASVSSDSEPQDSGSVLFGNRPVASPEGLGEQLGVSGTSSHAWLSSLSH